MISPTRFRRPTWIGFVSFLAIAAHTAALSVPASAGDAKQNSSAASIRERIDRGVVALPVKKGVYIGWRLLREDPPNIAFDVYRQMGAAPPVKVNRHPIRKMTDFLDTDISGGKRPIYIVRPVDGMTAVSGSAKTAPIVNGTPYLKISLKDPDTTFQKVGIADLDGDGAYDFVIKQPDQNIDPWHKYWHRSPGTYKIEAYLNDGRCLWQNDLGWAIEQGIWYSPWIAYDLDGDGKAEVAAKIGEGDPRDRDGRVTSGPEWVVVWDGMTGKELARAPWPNRSRFPEYNRASRNQIAVAYLDGKHPSLLTLRGTYGHMQVDAYRFAGGKLERIWHFDNGSLGREYQGQGAHFTLAADVDGDGRDEVILGSAVLDDNGKPLWTTGKGHPDAAYVSDIDPNRPGLEIAYVMETRQKRGGLCLVDARTGKPIWQLDEPTRHVHGKGLCADVDHRYPGMEIFGADSVSHKMTDRRWLFAANGKLLRKGPELNFPFTVRTAYWDADLQKELVNRSVTNYGESAPLARIEGKVQLIADVIGDWREEIITTVPGELRIYSTTLPAADRRVCLMQDPIYRLGTAMNSMGYTQEPTLSYCLSASSSPQRGTPPRQRTTHKASQESDRKVGQVKWKPSLLEGGYMFQNAKRFEAYVRRAEIVAVGVLTKWEGNKGQVRLESIIRGTLKDAPKDAAIPIHGTGGIVRPKAGDKVLLLLTSRDGKLRLHSFCAASGMYGYSRDLEKVLSGIVRSDDHSNRKP